MITGHPRKGGKLQIDFDALVRLNGTLIFLMGITAMESICTGTSGSGNGAGYAGGSFGAGNDGGAAEASCRM